MRTVKKAGTVIVPEPVTLAIFSAGSGRWFLRRCGRRQRQSPAGGA